MSSDLLSVVLARVKAKLVPELGMTAAARLSITSWANHDNLVLYIQSEEVRLRKELPASIAMMHILKVVIESHYPAADAIPPINIAEHYTYFVNHGFIQERMMCAYQNGSEKDVVMSRTLSPHACYVQQIEVQAAHLESFELTESEKTWGKPDWRLERLPGFRNGDLQDYGALSLFLTLLDHIKMNGEVQPKGSLMSWIYWYVRLSMPPNVNRVQTLRALWSLVDRISGGRIVFVGPDATPFPAVLTELRGLLMQWAGVKEPPTEDGVVADGHLFDPGHVDTNCAMFQMLHPIYPTPEAWDGFDHNAATHVCRFPPHRAPLLPLKKIYGLMRCTSGALTEGDATP